MSLVFPDPGNLILALKSSKKLQKILDIGSRIEYYTIALRRQQVVSTIIPAEDINNLLDCLCVSASFDAGIFFMSVIISVEVKYTHA